MDPFTRADSQQERCPGRAVRSLYAPQNGNGHTVGIQ